MKIFHKLRMIGLSLSLVFITNTCIHASDVELSPVEWKSDRCALTKQRSTRAGIPICLSVTLKASERNRLASVLEEIVDVATLMRTFNQSLSTPKSLEYKTTGISRIVRANEQLAARLRATANKTDEYLLTKFYRAFSEIAAEKAEWFRAGGKMLEARETHNRELLIGLGEAIISDELKPLVSPAVSSYVFEQRLAELIVEGDRRTDELNDVGKELTVDLLLDTGFRAVIKQ